MKNKASFQENKEEKEIDTLLEIEKLWIEVAEITIQESEQFADRMLQDNRKIPDEEKERNIFLKKELLEPLYKKLENHCTPHLNVDFCKEQDDAISTYKAEKTNVTNTAANAMQKAQRETAKEMAEMMLRKIFNPEQYPQFLEEFNRRKYTYQSIIKRMPEKQTKTK